MTLIQIISNLSKKKFDFVGNFKFSFLKVINFNTILIFSLIFFISLTFFISANYYEKKNQEYEANIKTITKSSGFSNLTNFFISKINSPYSEIRYVIKNNDSIEKILKKLGVENNDIKSISANLKRKNLSNIYSGRELIIVLKKNDSESNSVINLLFPISNTNSVEVRRTENEFTIRENILQLNKNEVVIKNEIKNNLYSSAVKVGVEPNIIVEFARIFGFEIDFQRDIREGDTFQILYEKFFDENGEFVKNGNIL